MYQFQEKMEHFGVKAITILSPSRDSASHVQLLETIMTAFSAERWLIIEDNLSI